MERQSTQSKHLRAAKKAPAKSTIAANTPSHQCELSMTATACVAPMSPPAPTICTWSKWVAGEQGENSVSRKEEFCGAAASA